MGASYFLTVHHKDLEGEGRALYVWGIKQKHIMETKYTPEVLDQIEIAKRIMSKYGYTCPAVVVEGKRSRYAKKSWVGIRFEGSAAVGDTFSTDDGCFYTVLEIVNP